LPPASRTNALPRGAETILVVEDDAACRQLASELLKHLGYKVLVAPDGGAALALASSHVGEIDLLITDMVMTGMNGRQLADSLVATQPGISVVYTSGYPESIIRNDAASQPIRYLGKPYTVRGLADEIRAALDEARTQP
jgi:CheY-like chemotaxis protein